MRLRSGLEVAHTATSSAQHRESRKRPHGPNFTGPQIFKKPKVDRRGSRPKISWGDLPAELRLLILEEVGKLEHQKHELASYATVSREWQYFFERKNFEYLAISQHDVSKFGKIVQKQRRSLVRWIWLRLRIPRYNCERCDKPESLEEIQRNNAMFIKAIRGLFGILSTWESKGPYAASEKGVTLELSAHSESDGKHYFLGIDSRIHDNGRSGKTLSFKKPPHSQTHGWIKGQRVKEPPEGAVDRIFGPICGLFLAVYHGELLPILPKVKVIQSLVIRRQFYRAFSITDALNLIIQCLTQLESFTYEPWSEMSRTIRDENGDLELQNNIDILDILNHAESLRRVTIWQDCNYERLHWIWHDSEVWPDSSTLSEYFIRSSQRLDGLHLSNYIDAMYLFAPFRPGICPSEKKGIYWKNLKYLSLTSSTLNPRTYHLVNWAAAGAAQVMPQLQVMEIRTHTRTEACILRYERRAYRPRVQFMSTWNGFLSTGEKKVGNRSTSVWQHSWA
ncbi:uncharacterized protein K452DRAFT_280763 [Aplosporella prunicola CBS 121167]|uniref:DUF6546 domain-containing protein n=1 Tax=Aplosporella prunicola CBS 121167 TaxID=1176127 RepID=A0A6A6AW48_9PEZI|nr:uncharacterized protein K452DRAFT_280763 [Aplosporella prunicola CBS 121167]KAF2135930.1 hypothetical protein K452DRAFT_280763 [Aplosporella prunicola CBS 121167]